jgi:hypothetical protein
MSVNPNPNQARRLPPSGPDRVICVVIETASGRTLTQAAGRSTRKKSAESMARVNAMRALKRKLGRRFVEGEYELAYRYG